MDEALDIEESVLTSAGRSFALAVADGRLQDAEKSLAIAFGVYLLGPGREAR